MEQPNQVRPFCPACGWSNIRPSARRGFVDGALALIWLAPFRCRNCRCRFYRFSRREGNEFTLLESTPAHRVHPMPAVYETAPLPQTTDLVPQQPAEPLTIAKEEPPDVAAFVEETHAILILDGDA